MTEATYHPILPRAELTEGGKKALKLQGENILLCQFEDHIFAVANMCSHANEPLECGMMRRGWIACPAHGARFDLETGEPIGGPTSVSIRTFPVRVVDDMIEVGL